MTPRAPKGEHQGEGVQVRLEPVPVSRMPPPPSGQPVLVLLLHGDPVVYKWNRTERRWYEARLRTPETGAVPKTPSALLAELVAGTSAGSPGSARSKVELAAALDHKVLATRDTGILRQWLEPIPEPEPVRELEPPRDARRPKTEVSRPEAVPRSQESSFWIDPRVVDADWWRVVEAEKAAHRCDDPLDTAYWLHEAEQAWVDSARWTPTGVLAKASAAWAKPQTSGSLPSATVEVMRPRRGR